MMDNTILYFHTLAEVLILCILVWFALQVVYIRTYVALLKRQAIRPLLILDIADKLLQHLRDKMDCNELIDKLLDEPEETPTPAREQFQNIPQKRERLAALATGGQSLQYIGRRSLTAEQVDEMADDEIEKLHARYESRLGAAMTTTLGAAAIRFYVAAVACLLPIPPDNAAKLILDLEEDPFVAHALNAASCSLYYKYGMCLAPVTMALTTTKHCQFGHVCPRTIPTTQVPEDGNTSRNSSGEGDCSIRDGERDERSQEGCCGEAGRRSSTG